MKSSIEIIEQSLQIEENEDCSLVSQIANQLHWLIVSNQVKTGDKLPAVRELADHLKVNLHTIRAAYHRLEANNMIQIKRGVGSVVIDYEPSDTIKSKSLPTHTIGVIVPDLGNPFYPAFLCGAARVAQENYFLIITSDTQEQYSLGKAHFEMLIAKQVEGILVAPWGLDPTEENIFLGDFYDYPIPLVFVDRPNINGYAVLLDSKNAGLLATQHLIEHGHEKIAMITGSLQVPTLNEVYQGYQFALKKNGLTMPPGFVIEANGFTYEEGYRIAQLLFQMADRPTAIFAAGDMYAIGAIKALQDNHLTIPDDVAMIGYNNIDVSSFITPKLTTVSTPIQELGRISAEHLVKLIKKQGVGKKKITLQSELVLRESCGCQSFDGISQEIAEEIKEVY